MTDVRRERIPLLWSRVRERTLAKVLVLTWVLTCKVSMFLQENKVI